MTFRGRLAWGASGRSGRFFGFSRPLPIGFLGDLIFLTHRGLNLETKFSFAEDPSIWICQKQAQKTSMFFSTKKIMWLIYNRSYFAEKNLRNTFSLGQLELQQSKLLRRRQGLGRRLRRVEVRLFLRRGLRGRQQTHGGTDCCEEFGSCLGNC